MRMKHGLQGRFRQQQHGPGHICINRTLIKERLLVEFSCESPTRYPNLRFINCAIIYHWISGRHNTCSTCIYILQKFSPPIFTAFFLWPFFIYFPLALFEGHRLILSSKEILTISLLHFNLMIEKVSTLSNMSTPYTKIFSKSLFQLLLLPFLNLLLLLLLLCNYFLFSGFYHPLGLLCSYYLFQIGQKLLLLRKSTLHDSLLTLKIKLRYKRNKIRTWQ